MLACGAAAEKAALYRVEALEFGYLSKDVKRTSVLFIHGGVQAGDSGAIEELEFVRVCECGKLAEVEQPIGIGQLMHSSLDVRVDHVIDALRFCCSGCAYGSGSAGYWSFRAAGGLGGLDFVLWLGPQPDLAHRQGSVVLAPSPLFSHRPILSHSTLDTNTSLFAADEHHLPSRWHRCEPYFDGCSLWPLPCRSSDSRVDFSKWKQC